MSKLISKLKTLVNENKFTQNKTKFIFKNNDITVTFDAGTIISLHINDNKVELNLEDRRELLQLASDAQNKKIEFTQAIIKHNINKFLL